MKVIILNSCTIPGLGRGPINIPIEASLIDLKKFDVLGIRYKIVEDEINISELKPAQVVSPARPIIPEEEQKVEEESELEEVPEEEVATPEIEEKVEEVVEDEKEVEVYTEEDVEELTKKELQNILKEHEVEYKYADTVPVLKEKVIGLEK